MRGVFVRPVIGGMGGTPLARPVQNKPGAAERQLPGSSPVPSPLADTGPYFAVPVSTLRIDVVTDFDLYLEMPGKPAVLYRAASLSFTEEARARLNEARVATLLVSKKQSEAYHAYVEANLGAVLADDGVPLDDRAALLYESSTFVMQQLMQAPRSGPMLPRAKRLVNHTTAFLFHEGAAIRSLMRLTSYDYYTYTHSVNVFLFSIALAQHLGHGEAKVCEFGEGALLHDIGKSQIDPAVVNCRGKLTSAQWREMRRHPEFGQSLLFEMGVTSPLVLDVTRHHHEKINGTGYPDGLRGGQVSLWARIASICDIFDALTTRRSYKAAMHSFPGLRLMQDEMGGEIDAEIFKSFVVMLGNE